MSDRFDYWIHGVNVQVEYTDPGRELYIRRAGFGTVIRQRVGTNNWFHLAIPTPLYLDDDEVVYRGLALSGYINNKATIRKVDIWHGRQRILTQNVSLSSKDLYEYFDLADRKCRGPMVVCVFVEFDGIGGEIRFDGAGVHFDEL